MAIDLGCHVGYASPEETGVRSDGMMKQEETDRSAVVDDVEAAAGDGGVNYVARAQWLRAAVLGANDGLVSVASLMIGVGAVNGTRRAMLVAGLAGLPSGGRRNETNVARKQMPRGSNWASELRVFTVGLGGVLPKCSSSDGLPIMEAAGLPRSAARVLQRLRVSLSE
uniref:Vacuolar iron transporter n=1 Tax=Oryza brachyantha TaxID=4533 RepID=J3LF96_ORYBR